MVKFRNGQHFEALARETSEKKGREVIKHLIYVIGTFMRNVAYFSVRNREQFLKNVYSLLITSKKINQDIVLSNLEKGKLKVRK